MTDKGPDYASAPAQHLVEGLKLYLSKGVPQGSFLMALLQNQKDVARRAADAINKPLVDDWFTWLRRNMPQGSWGSPRIVELWCDSKEDT